MTNGESSGASEVVAGEAPEGGDALLTGSPPALTVAARSFGLLALEGFSIGLALWSLRRHDRLLEYVTDNTLSTAARSGAVKSALAGVLVASAAGGLLAWSRRPVGLEAVRRLSLRCSPLALAAFFPLLLHWQLWVDRDLDFLALASGCILSLRVAFRASLSTPPVFALALPSRLAAQLKAGLALPGLPLAAVGCGALAYAIYFSHHTLNTHYRIETSVYDLGVENNLVWHAVHWSPLFRSTPLGGTMTHLGYHQTYFAYVLGLVYRFAPRPETLLVIQSVMLGFAAVPLFFLAKRRLGAQVACLIALMYLLYAPLHGSNLYDFHYQPLGVFFLWLTLYLLEERRDRWAAVSVLLLLSVREDMSALLAVIGAYLVVTGERPRAGLIVTLVGALYFVGLKLVIMPILLDGESAYVNQYAGLLPPGEASFAGVLKTALANPGFTIKVLLEKDKLIYVLQLLAPLAFLSLRRPTGFLLLAPGFFFTLLSTAHVPSIRISFQYTAYWTPFVFIAAIAHLAWIESAEVRGKLPAATRRSWLLVLPIAMVITSYQHGAVLQHNTARTHFIPYRFGVTAADHRRHDDLYALIAQMPSDAAVASSEWVVPQVSSRADSYALRDGVYDADYMLVSLDVRPEDELENIRAALGSGQFGIVEQRGQYALAKRGYPPAKNPEFLAQLGSL